jgi:serine/threonine-protein kinase RsbW
VIEAPPAVRLDLESRPQTLTLVRGMLGGIAELLAIDPELLDDLKTAVSEACNNVVLHAYAGEVGPMQVRLYLGVDRIRVAVRDSGVGISERATAEPRAAGVGLPVIRALADEVQFTRPSDGGTELQMEFSARRDGRPLFIAPGAPGDDDGRLRRAAGEVAVSLSPVALVSGVLGRLARALAAGAHFSLDRFSDVYLVTDALAAHAAVAAAGPRMSCRLLGSERRLELTVGPFKAGTAERLLASTPGRPAAPLTLLSDELTAESDGEGELLHVVMIDRRR